MIDPAVTLRPVAKLAELSQAPSMPSKVPAVFGHVSWQVLH
jgi:hypothetical protein